MGITKKELFSNAQNQLASYAKVLGHPARIAILEHLLKAEQCINGDLVNELGLAQATISQHLSELKKVGLISGSTEGTSICYCINHDAWKEIQQELNRLFDLHPQCNDSNCC